jgi:hypothetical protein
MKPIASALHELVAQYRARGMNHGDGLLPPADAAAISSAETMLGFSLPEPLREVYAVFGGQQSTCPGITGLLGAHRLHSPSGITEAYDMFQQAEKFPDNTPPPVDSIPGVGWTRWHPALIPFASWDAYHLVMCRLTTRIFEFEPFTGLSEKSFAGMSALLEAILEAAKTSLEPSLDFITPE